MPWHTRQARLMIMVELKLPITRNPMGKDRGRAAMRGERTKVSRGGVGAESSAVTEGYGTAGRCSRAAAGRSGLREDGEEVVSRLEPWRDGSSGETKCTSGELQIICRCSSCSELHLSDLVIDSFCCPRSTCLGAPSELTYYKSKENYVHVSLKESDVCKLSLPHVSKVDEDTEKFGKLFFRNDVDVKIDPGYCMSCRSQLKLSSALATSDRAASKINRFKELTVIGEVTEVAITDALQSLEQIKKLRHPYSKALAQAEDMIAEAFAKLGDQGQARKHCEASIKILEKLYHPKHIAIAHELIKLVSIELSLGDRASAQATFARAEAIFSLYYGPDVQRILPYVDALQRTVSARFMGAP